MAVTNGEDSVNAMLNALETATANLTSALRVGTFDRETRQDDFFVRLDQQSAEDPFIKLALFRGFVASTPALVILGAGSRAGLAESPATITSQVDVDLEKGIVSIPVDVDLGDAAGTVMGWFRVSYTSGFASEDEATYSGVPAWLAQAAQLDARIALNSHPDFVANQSATDARMLERQLGSIVDGKRRYLPWATLPKASRTV